MRVVVADDDRLTAHTLSDSLARYGLDPVAVTHTPGQALEQTITLRPDCLVIDLDFGPGPNGLDVATRARRILPLLGVVVITAFEDPRLQSPRQPDTPIGSVYLVKQQIENPEQVAVAARLAVELANNPSRSKESKRKLELSDTQAELLRLVALGFSNQAISQQLFQTPDSVKKSISRLAKKLEVDNSAEKNARVALTQRYLQLSGHFRA